VLVAVATYIKKISIVLGSSCAGLYFGLLVVAVKGVVSIDPFVITVGPDQLNLWNSTKGCHDFKAWRSSLLFAST
jgi:hypothetical protein